VRDYDAVKAMVLGAHAALGGLDIVVANAGVPTRFEPLHEVDIGYWKRVISIDLDGVFHTLHAAAPAPARAEIGRDPHDLVDRGRRAPGERRALHRRQGRRHALTKVVARENARLGIRANVVAPGLIQTDIADGMLAQHGERLIKAIPLGRIGTPEEVAQLCVYLASDAAAWITGKVFHIDGGQW